MYYCCGITDKGVMSHNEDAFLIGKTVADKGGLEQKLDAPFITAVSDGVSGEKSGEFASRMCLEYVRNVDFSGDISGSLMEVHNTIAEYSMNNPDLHNMQATLCGLFFGRDGSVTAFNAGDSRLYRFRNGHITQISRDQSLVQLMYEEGSITPEQRKNHIRRNIIFPVFGNVDTLPEIDLIQIEDGMQYGDILLLCTDGLSDYVSALEMEEILEMPISLHKRVSLLVRKALENNSTDNITIIAIVYFD
ncbi:MAG: protein phosphatase 2C domain-containing protein [Ruminococcus sp.]|nr:protein phosphatase 2C domain-containing protein [Ruminococcus sp.]MDE6678431.1 protein phosphatase 2C domain-containing protein [Ruminococcus sp.]